MPLPYWSGQRPPAKANYTGGRRSIATGLFWSLRYFRVMPAHPHSRVALTTTGPLTPSLRSLILYRDFRWLSSYLAKLLDTPAPELLHEYLHAILRASRRANKQKPAPRPNNATAPAHCRACYPIIGPKCSTYWCGMPASARIRPKPTWRSNNDSAPPHCRACCTPSPAGGVSPGVSPGLCPKLPLLPIVSRLLMCLWFRIIAGNRFGRLILCRDNLLRAFCRF
jgi:hypothetical protein